MNWLNTVTLIIGIVIIVTMIWACYEQVLQELVVESPMLGVSKAWFAASMPVGPGPDADPRAPGRGSTRAPRRCSAARPRRIVSEEGVPR